MRNSSFDNSDILAFAECIELYAHRNRLILRLEMQDYEAAFLLCQEATEWGENLLELEPTSDGREKHRRNVENLYELQLMITEAASRENSGREVQTTAY